MKTNKNHFNSRQGLYDPSYEHDACGVGMLVNIHGEKSHDIIESALKVLENMRHRGAEGADNKTGDGAGILLQLSLIHISEPTSSSSCKEFRFQRKANMAPD